MYGLETINAMNRDAGDRAREAGLEPLVLDDCDDIDALFGGQGLSIPNLGDACGYVEAPKVDLLFCDSSGFGRPGEPALTQDQFEAKLRGLLEEHGPLMVAIEEAGQFQVHVQVWTV